MEQFKVISRFRDIDHIRCVRWRLHTFDARGGWFATGWFATGWFGTGWFSTGWFGTGWFAAGWFGTGWFAADDMTKSTGSVKLVI
jgi:hypothetical protein